MNTQPDDNLNTDEFEPIELGSVAEETRGIEGAPGENFVSLNSRD